MRMILLLLICCTIFFSCKKTDAVASHTQAGPQYTLTNINALTPSGATLYFTFLYSGQLPTGILEKSNVSNLFRYSFASNNNQLTSMNAYSVQTDTAGILEDSMVFSYTGKNLTRIDWYYNAGTAMLLSGYVVYTYSSGGKPIDKTGYGGTGTNPPVPVAHTVFNYDSSGDIVSCTINNLMTGAAVAEIDFQFTYNSVQNNLFADNPWLYTCWWWLMDPNEFADGYLDALAFSAHYATNATRIISGNQKQYPFTYSYDQNNNIISLNEFDNVFNDFNNVLYYQMGFTYTSQ
jgi:hypothetical protein